MNLSKSSTNRIFTCLVLALLLSFSGISKAAAEGAPIGARFILTDHQGQIRTDRDFLDSYVLLAFGYTFCPDICPTALSTMGTALDAVGEGSEKIIPAFISVDPERDTTARLREFVPNFHPRMIGLTGQAAMIARTAKGYRAIYNKVPDPGGDPEFYTIDHTASIFLMAPGGKFLVKFAHAMDPEKMAERIRDFLK